MSQDLKAGGLGQANGGASSTLDDDVAAILGVDPRDFAQAASPSGAHAGPRHLRRGIWISAALVMTAGASAVLTLAPVRRVNESVPAGREAAVPMAEMLVDAPPHHAVMPAAPTPPVATAAAAAPTELARSSSGVHPAVTHRSAEPSMGQRFASLGDANSLRRPSARAAEAPFRPSQPAPEILTLRDRGNENREIADAGTRTLATRTLSIAPAGHRWSEASLSGPAAEPITRLQSPAIVRSVQLDAVDAIRLLRQK